MNYDLIDYVHVPMFPAIHVLQDEGKRLVGFGVCAVTKTEVIEWGAYPAVFRDAQVN